MTHGSQRSGRARREASRSSRRRGHSRRRERGRSQRRQVFDRRLAAVAAAITVALLAIARYYFEPTGPVGWSWPILMLCVLVAAAAGRALLGHQSADEEEERRPYRGLNAAVWLLLLAAATVPNLHGLSIGFIADDFGLLRAARLAEGPLDIARLLPLRIFYRPLPLLVWWLGLHLWGGAPLGYHVFSLLLHAGNTALLYLLARRYMGSLYGGAMAALFFAVHPTHVEATVWPSAQPDLLCTGFVLLSMWFLEQYIATRGGHRRYLALAAALVAFLFALWSKEAAAALPGVVFVRLLVLPGARRWLHAVQVTGAYALTIGVYLAVRFVVLGGKWLGGQEVNLTLWDAVSSPMPLLLTGQLLFPVHVSLFRPLLTPYLWLAALALMAAGLLWWIRSLVFVSWRQLVLYASYLLVLMIPVATAGLTIGADMANSRYGYLPSAGLALLFGGICAQRPRGWRRNGLVGVVTLAVAAVLSMWYLAVPWRGAARVRDDVLSKGVRAVQSLPDSPPPSTVFFKGVPWYHLGVMIFVEGGFSSTLASLVDGEVSVEDVSDTTAAWDAMSASDLLPGEYLMSWDADSQTMVMERAGPPAADRPVAEVSP